MLAANTRVAVEFAERWESEHPGELLVFKALYARTGHTAIVSNKGTKPKGVSSFKQVRQKFGVAAKGPIIIQPYKEPDTLVKAGVRFIGTTEENLYGAAYADQKFIRSVKHIGSANPAERVKAGMESNFLMLFRSFVVYLPKEKRLVHIGGIWQATDGRIIHGGSFCCWPAVC